MIYMQQESFREGIQIFEKLNLTTRFVLFKSQSDGNFHLIEFNSKYFVLKIENYHRELYPTLYKRGYSNFEINLFNLLDYLVGCDQDVPQSNFYKDEKDLDECFRKQFLYISHIISNYIEVLCNFFSDSRFESNAKKFEAYWKIKHPEFYIT